MASLREQDVHAVLDLVGEAHDAQDVSEFRAVVLPSVRRMVPCDVCSYNEVADGHRVVAVVMEPQAEQWTYDIWERHAGENPLLQRYRRTRDGRSYRFSDVIAPDALEALPLYRKLFMPLDLTHQIAFGLPSPHGLTIGVALSRGGQDFSENDRRLLDLARPHLAQAYRNARLRERTSSTVSALRRGLDDSGDALIVLEEQCRVAFASSAAGELITAATGERLSEGEELPAQMRGWSLRQQSGRVISPLVIEGATPIIARFIPPRTGELPVIALERRGRAVGLSVLEAMGLTRREAQVLDAFVRGASTDAAAEQLRISPRTVHKHSQSIHAKLGVGGRAEAIAAAWSTSGNY